MKKKRKGSQRQNLKKLTLYMIATRTKKIYKIKLE